MVKRRDWSEARRKVDAQRGCRVCGRYPVQAAHVRSRHMGGSDSPLNIVGLCWTCHTAFDEHRMDLLGYLDVDEQANAVLECGGIENARQRLAPSLYEKSHRQQRP